MNIEVLNIEGLKSKSVDISENVTGLKVNNKLLKYVIDWQLNHAKRRLAKTKQRNEIKGSTKKAAPKTDAKKDTAKEAKKIPEKKDEKKNEVKKK